MISVSNIIKNSLNYPFYGVSKVLVTALIYLLASLFLVTFLTFLFPNFIGSFSISYVDNIFAVSASMICIILAFIVFFNFNRLLLSYYRKNNQNRKQTS